MDDKANEKEYFDSRQGDAVLITFEMVEAGRDRFFAMDVEEVGFAAFIRAVLTDMFATSKTHSVKFIDG